MNGPTSIARPRIGDGAPHPRRRFPPSGSRRRQAPLQGLVLWLAAILVSQAALAGPSGARILEGLTTRTGKPFAIPAPEARGIPNFAEIEPGLARGGRPTPEGIRWLRSRGYRTVIDLTASADERRALERAGIDFVGIPLHAGLLAATPPSPREIRIFLAVVTDSSRRPVFFHCRRGRDRTGVMAAVYRMEVQGWKPSEAIEEMRAFGFSGHYRRLLRFVRDYRTSEPERRAP